MTHDRLFVDTAGGATRRSVEHALVYVSEVEMYNQIMITMTISELREQLASAVESARIQPVLVERRGQPAGVLVSPEHYEELLSALEEIEDIAAFDEAMAEEGPNIPWEQVKADLGWD